jgi:hypothetical protein
MVKPRAMFIEFFERLFGYDQWIETTARFEAADLQKHVQNSTYVGETVSYTSRDTIVWTDQQGGQHRASFSVGEGSPVYQQYDGSQVTIRYNPARPDRFYYRDLFVTRVRSAITTILVGAGLIALYWFDFKR